MKDEYIDDIFDILLKEKDSRDMFPIFVTDNLNDIKVITQKHIINKVTFTFHYNINDKYMLNISEELYPEIYKYYSIGNGWSKSIYVNIDKITNFMILNSYNIIGAGIDKETFNNTERKNIIYYYEDDEYYYAYILRLNGYHYLFGYGDNNIFVKLKKTECQISHLYDNMKNLNDLLK